MSYLIGVDVGSTNLKVVVHDVGQRTQVVYGCPTRTHYPTPGWAEYDPVELWSDLTSLFRSAVADLPNPASVKAIAVASMGEAGLLLDARGSPLTPIIAWFDNRTTAEAAWWHDTVGPDAVYAVTGHPIHPSYGVNKLMWWRTNRPDLFSKAAHWVSVEDFVLHRLSGVLATDYSVASRTMAFDIAVHRWSESLFGNAGLDGRLMPPAFPGGTVVGQVTRTAARVTGLLEGTPVVTGGHDHICASFAAGAFAPGALLDSTGTSESVILTVPDVLRGPAMLAGSFAQECHVLPDRYAVLAGMPVAGYALEWLNRVLEGGGIALDYGLAEAAKVPPGAEGLFFLPHLRGAGSPAFDPLSRAAFIGLTGAHGRGHFLRAAVEGVCYELERILLELESATGYAPTEMYATGKVTQSDLWLRTKADVTGKKLKVPHLSESAGVGAALLAGLGVGLYASPEEAVSSLQAGSLQVEPDPERATFYGIQYDTVYRKIFPALKDLFHAGAAVGTA